MKNFILITLLSNFIPSFAFSADEYRSTPPSTTHSAESAAVAPIKRKRADAASAPSPAETTSRSTGSEGLTGFALLLQAAAEHSTESAPASKRKRGGTLTDPDEIDTSRTDSTLSIGRSDAFTPSSSSSSSSSALAPASNVRVLPLLPPMAGREMQRRTAPRSVAAARAAAYFTSMPELLEPASDGAGSTAVYGGAAAAPMYGGAVAAASMLYAMGGGYPYPPYYPQAYPTDPRYVAPAYYPGYYMQATQTGAPEEPSLSSLAATLFAPEYSSSSSSSAAAAAIPATSSGSSSSETMRIRTLSLAKFAMLRNASLVASKGTASGGAAAGVVAAAVTPVTSSSSSSKKPTHVCLPEEIKSPTVEYPPIDPEAVKAMSLESIANETNTARRMVLIVEKAKHVDIDTKTYVALIIGKKSPKHIVDFNSCVDASCKAWENPAVDRKALDIVSAWVWKGMAGVDTEGNDPYTTYVEKA